jgi:hypothetical protein
MGIASTTVIIEPFDVLVRILGLVALWRFNRPHKQFDRYREDGYAIAEDSHC